MSIQANADKSQCSLLLFLATPDEETGLHQAARAHGIPFEPVRRNQSPIGEDYHWLGPVGDETVIAIGPVRSRGHLVMGSIGFLGTAARAMRVGRETGAQGIVQLGMAFGVDPRNQRPGDVLVSTAIIPYDNRVIRHATDERYLTEYPNANRESARPALVERFRREQRRGNRGFGVYLGAMLSGAARIGSSVYRDELVRDVPAGPDPIVGGEMEGVGLLAASSASDDPIWCVVKGISDFADRDRDAVIEANRPVACRNAAEFLLSALLNDAVE